MKEFGLGSLGFSVLVSLVLVMGIFGQTYMHELVHVQNFKAENINSVISFNGTTALTTPEETYPSNEVLNRIKIENSFNEAVAYNVTPLAFMICGILIFCTLYLGDRK